NGNTNNHAPELNIRTPKSLDFKRFTELLKVTYRMVMAFKGHLPAAEDKAELRPKRSQASRWRGSGAHRRSHKVMCLLSVPKTPVLGGVKINTPHDRPYHKRHAQYAPGTFPCSFCSYIVLRLMGTIPVLTAREQTLLRR